MSQAKRIYKIDSEKLREIRDKIFKELDSLKENLFQVIDEAKREIDTLFALLTDLSEYEEATEPQQEEEIRIPRITEKQKQYLIDLYHQLGREPPDDLDTWSRATASYMIEELRRRINKKKGGGQGGV